MYIVLPKNIFHVGLLLTYLYFCIYRMHTDSMRELTNEFIFMERDAQMKRECVYEVTKTKSATDIEKNTTEKLSDISKVSQDEHIEDKLETETSAKFDIKKIRSDTLCKNIISEQSVVTKEQVKPVIDDILQKSTVVIATKSPTTEKDIKTIIKDVVDTERRSYDAKAVGKDERRHSCISPAISLERIAESEIEIEEEVSKFMSSIVADSKKSMETTSQTIKKSDSAMKQMADNIEIIIKQASEDIDLSQEETVEELKIEDLAEHVSVDSIIEEAVNTVEEYLETSKDVKEKEIEIKKDIIYEETKKFVKDRPTLMKSLSKDSGEVVILPKKKQTRTFSVQSSPDEVEEQIYTDSESG